MWTPSAAIASASPPAISHCCRRQPAERSASSTHSRISGSQTALLTTFSCWIWATKKLPKAKTSPPTRRTEPPGSQHPQQAIREAAGQEQVQRPRNLEERVGAQDRAEQQVRRVEHPQLAVREQRVAAEDQRHPERQVAGVKLLQVPAHQRQVEQLGVALEKIEPRNRSSRNSTSVQSAAPGTAQISTATATGCQPTGDPLPPLPLRTGET